MKKKFNHKTAVKKIPCRLYLEVPTGPHNEYADMHELQNLKKAIALRKLIESDAKHRVKGATIGVWDECGEPVEERLFDGAQWIDNPNRGPNYKPDNVSR